MAEGMVVDEAEGTEEEPQLEVEEDLKDDPDWEELGGSR